MPEPILALPFDTPGGAADICLLFSRLLVNVLLEEEGDRALQWLKA